MATNEKLSLIISVGEDGYVSTDEVLTLRRTIFADGVVDAEELDALFALGERAPAGDPAWADYFVEATADFYLREEEPHGYLTTEEFETLRARVTRDGAIASALELGLLIRLMETATSTPPQMAGFVGEQIKARIHEKPGGAKIDAGDVEIIRRYIFASGGDGNVAVTRKEAEFLFDLSDAAAENDPSWCDLFKKAVSNHLMAHIGFEPIARADALALETPDPDDGGPIPSKRAEDENAVEAGKRGFFDMLGNVFSPKRAHAERVEARYKVLNAARERDAAIAEKVTASEADWLADRIGRDGVLHPSEKALVAYMRDELGADLPPKLKALVEKAA